MTQREYKVAEAMRRVGGSFVRSLGQMFALADDTNFAKLKAAFPEYWAEYERIVDLENAKREDA